MEPEIKYMKAALRDAYDFVRIFPAEYIEADEVVL